MGELIAETTRNLTLALNKEGKEREIETRGDLVKADAVATADDSGSLGSSTSLNAPSFFWSRKLDGLYLIFFMVHIPTILRTYIPARVFFFLPFSS